jgi:hypothetical protein
MNMQIDIPDKQGLREFGLITGGLFVGLFGLLFPWLFGFDWPLWPWIVAGVLSGLALLIPNGLRPIYYGWMTMALILGWINTRLLLGIVFFLIITPMGFIMRLFGHNPMIKKPCQSDSYRLVTKPRSVQQHMEQPF